MSQSDFVSRGQALVAAGQFQEAVKVCRLGLLGRPTTVEGRVVLGQALLALKRFDEVLAEMRVALELDHASIAAQVLRAEALLRKRDVAGAAEALHQARQLAPGDPRIMQLLGEIERDAGKPPASASHPAVGFVGGGDTRHYPSREPEPQHGDEDSGGSYTRPTSLAAPSAIKRTSDRRPAAMAPDVDLSVGDRSGTVEVDPELEAVQLPGDDDFDAVAAPPVARAKLPAPRRSPAREQAPRDQVPQKRSTPAIEIEDEDLLELSETRLPPAEARGRPGASAVRQAVGRPSGPLDAPAMRPNPPSAPPPLARAIAAQPHVLDVHPSGPTPQPLPPPPAGARPSLAAALPTMAASDFPSRPMPLGGPGQGPDLGPATPAQLANAARPTVAIPAPVPAPPAPLPLPYAQVPAGPDPRFPAAVPVAPPWAPAGTPDPRALGAPMEMAARPGPIDPAIAALMAGSPAESGAVVALGQRVATPVPAPRAPAGGGKRQRSRLQLAMWVLVGIVVIGGGVFAGFQIRAMRLEKDIAEARHRATELAKADTWDGWIAARDRLADIEQASDTLANRAALARARAVIAFEFGDGLADAKAAVDGLDGGGGLDGKLAAAYLALAESDAKAATLAAADALAKSPDDPAALYVAGRAALLAGDLRTAENRLRAAEQHEPRPLYGVGLARALAAATTWDDAEKEIDRVHAAHPDNPAAAIARGEILAEAGRLGDAGLAAKVHAELAQVVVDGAPRPGVPTKASPAQVAFADLALARVDFARGELTPAKTDVAAAAAVPGVGDQQAFAEDATETLLAIGDLVSAATAADGAIAQWPHSLRAHVARAEIAIAQGKPGDALDLLAKQADVTSTAAGLAVRGEAKLASGDDDGARADFDAALKQVPTLEPALVGAAWIDLAAGDVAQARARIEPRFQAGGASAEVAVAYAAVLREAGDPASRDKAKDLLDKVIAGPPGVASAHAQLELARLDRDTGDYKAARAAFQEAAHAGDGEARLEYGELLIDDADPRAGRDELDELLAQAGDHASPALVLATARARMLAGDNTGADQLLAGLAKQAGVSKWKLARERGRLALRRGQYTAAAAELSKALDGCGKDVDTYLLAADVVTSDVANAGALATKVKQLAATNLGAGPEQDMVDGKLLIATEDYKGAEDLFEKAKDALDKRKAPSRLLAQARFGSAVAKYYLQSDADARNELMAVRDLDPSLSAADLFMAELQSDKDPASALKAAEQAVSFDPDLVPGWALVGQLAAKAGDRKTLADAIGKLAEIAPNSPELKQLQALRR